MVWIHAAPFAVMIVDALNSRVAFRMHDVKYLIVVLIVYAPVNYAFTHTYGRPVYRVLTWEDAKTPILLLFTLFFTLLVQKLMTWCSAHRMRQQLEKRMD